MMKIQDTTGKIRKIQDTAGKVQTIQDLATHRCLLTTGNSLLLAFHLVTETKEINV